MSVVVPSPPPPLLICFIKFLLHFQLVISIERRVGPKFATLNEGGFKEPLQSTHAAPSQNMNHYLTVFDMFEVALPLHTIFYHLLITRF